jgi:putative ABC transport system permease protein
MTGVVRDLRLAVRRLLKSPSFALTAVLSLALGIGANTTVFSVVHGVLFSSLPYPDSDRLVELFETRAGSDQPVSLLSFGGWRDAATGLAGMAAVRRWPFNVTGGDRPFRVTGVQASADLLAVLGARPYQGREFTRQDEQPGADAVCMVSHAFWIERLGGARTSRPSAWSWTVAATRSSGCSRRASPSPATGPPRY